MPRQKREYGQSGLKLFNGQLLDDHNRNLRGTKAIAVYNEMRRDEPAATGFLSAAGNLLRTDLFVEPGGKTRRDANAARFAESILTDMKAPIGTYLRQLYSCIWAGWDVHEIVWKRRTKGASRYTDGRVAPTKLALRRQETLDRWGTKPGKPDQIVSFVQRPAPTYQLIEIPLTRCVHVVADDSDGSPEGLSPLRGMYRQWYFVKNFELLLGISMERFGTGMPVFSNEDGVDLTDVQLDALEAVAQRLRQNEYAYVIEPKGIRFRFEPSPGLNAVTYLDAIMRMRTWMLSTVLADFIALGAGGKGGAYALGKDKSELFLLALNGYQDRVLGALNRQLMPWLFKYNDVGTLTDLPRFALPAVKRYDLKALGGFLSVLKNLGAFHPQPEDEIAFRKIADVADVDPAKIKQLFKIAETLGIEMSPPDQQQDQPTEDESQDDSSDDGGGDGMKTDTGTDDEGDAMPMEDDDESMG